jgi:hypothetical protein
LSVAPGQSPFLLREPPQAGVLLPDPDYADSFSVLQRLSAAIRLLDLYRQQNPANHDKALRLLLRRLARVRSVFEKTASDTNLEK